MKAIKIKAIKQNAKQPSRPNGVKSRILNVIRENGSKGISAWLEIIGLVSCYI